MPDMLILKDSNIFWVEISLKLREMPLCLFCMFIFFLGNLDVENRSFISFILVE